jgi:hypothetical protein
MNPWDISTTQVTLQKTVFNSAMEVDPTLFSRNVETQSYLDEITRRQVLRFRYFVYASKPQKETHEVKYPTTWWDAFKLAYPRLCRYCKAAEYTTVKVSWEGKALFPEIPLMGGEYRSFVRWENPIEELL